MSNNTKDEQVEPITGGTAVFAMRDRFSDLAKCYLEMGDFEAAQHAAVMAKSLEDFEWNHNLTGIEWPPRVMKDDYGRPYLAGNKDTAYERT
jgi:hypothetical protein